MSLIFHETHQRLRLLWSWALLSPIIYLFAGRIMLDTGWISPAHVMPHPGNTIALRWVLGLTAVLLAGANVWLRLNRRQLCQSPALSRPQAVRRLTYTFYTMAILADGLTCVGLIYFMASGNFWAVLTGGVGSYLSYGLAYPQQRDLTGLARLQPGEEEC